MTDTTLVIGDKSTTQVLDEDSGAGEVDEDRIHVPLTGAFAPGDTVWVNDDNSAGELATILAIFANDYLQTTVNLTGLYTLAENAWVRLAHVVSNYVIDADVQKNKVTNIGTCNIRLDNDADIWGGVFATNDTIILAVNGTIIFVGKVKDVAPYLTESGVYTNELTITGVDAGRYGSDYYFTTKYETQAGGVIIDKILASLGDPWLYTDPGGTPNVKYEGKRTWLEDAVREICDEMGYDFYVDHNGRLQIFVSGVPDSGVDLISLVGDPTSNLLSFKEFEQEGGDVRNVIEISAGNVKDHYAEENAGDWTAGGGGAVADEIDDGIGIDQVIYGKGSIKLTCTGAISRGYLDFSAGLVLANYGFSGSVNLLPFCQAKVLVKGARDGEDRFSLRPFLVDTGNKKIVFTRRKSGAGSKGITEDLADYLSASGGWNVITYPLGAHDGNPVRAIGNEVNGNWTFTVGVAPFDWEHVKYVGFEYPFTEDAVIFIDGWTIPSLEVKYITEDATSKTDNDPRMYHEYKREFRSMPQLKAYGDRVKGTKKDPLVKFKAVAIGQVGTLYAGQFVHVRAPQHGIAGLTKYIIVRLQHILRKNSDVRGFDFWTTYDLVTTDADASRVIRSDNPYTAMLREIRRQNRGFKGGMDDDDFFIGDAETGSRVGFTEGATFPTDPADEDIHKLTTDIANYYGNEGVWYRWNETVGDWERSPLVMHRAVQPPAGGGKIGDTWHDTANDLWYRCTAEDADVWTLINFAATSISGEVAASQLAIEQRDWHSNLNFIWDVANKDWDEIWWGLTGNEAGADAVIEFSDGTTTTIDRGTEAALADGTYIYYWDEAVKAGGTYQLVRDTFVNWDNGVGAGKGIVFVVVIDEAGANPPSFFPFNSYMATVGVGMLSSWTVKTHHLTAESIHGKDIANQASVGEGGGNAGIRIIGDAADIVGVAIGDAIGGVFTAGIWGFKAGPTRTFFFDPATGIINTYGTGMFIVRKANGNLVGYIDGGTTDIGLGGGAQDALMISAPTLNDVLKLEASGRSIWLDSTAATAQIVFDNDWNRLVPRTDGGVDIGTALLRWGKYWGEDGDFELQLTIPRYNGADPGAPVSGDIWLRIDL